LKFWFIFWLWFCIRKHAKNVFFAILQFIFLFIFLVGLFKRSSRRYFPPIFLILIYDSLYLLLFLWNISDVKDLRQIISLCEFHIHLILFILLLFTTLFSTLKWTPPSYWQFILFSHLLDKLLSALLLTHCPGHRSESIWVLSFRLSWFCLNRFFLFAVVIVECLFEVAFSPADEFTNFLRIY
jgi:hypothetical protein